MLNGEPRLGVLLGGTTHGPRAYRPLCPPALARTPSARSGARCASTPRDAHQLSPPPHAPARVAPAGSGTTSTNWPRNHLRQHAPESARVRLDAESVHELCLASDTSTSLPPPRELPGLERRRRWSHRTRARAQAACHRQPSPTRRSTAAVVGGKPRARSARRGTSDGGATGCVRASTGAAPSTLRGRCASTLRRAHQLSRVHQRAQARVNQLNRAGGGGGGAARSRRRTGRGRRAGSAGRGAGRRPPRSSRRRRRR